MTLGEFIKNKGTKLGMDRNLFATQTGISYTEVQRIENNGMEMPSLKIL